MLSCCDYDGAGCRQLAGDLLPRPPTAEKFRCLRACAQIPTIIDPRMCMAKSAPHDGPGRFLTNSLSILSKWRSAYGRMASRSSFAFGTFANVAAGTS
eukprot:scaffold92551_cov32-Tisochrysis_lutea.AAC.5